MNLFAEHQLDPASRLGEIIFGLIMVLSITLSASLTVSDGPEGVRQLLAAAIGCNIAWGIIDGAMYVMNALFERSRKSRLILALQATDDRTAALEVIREEFDSQLEPIASPASREALYESMLEHLAEIKVRPTMPTTSDIVGAVWCFWLVFVSCIPAAIPFLIMDEPHRALRVSNALLVVLLFVVGWRWAGYTHTNRLAASLTLVGGALLLVGLAIALGG